MNPIYDSFAVAPNEGMNINSRASEYQEPNLMHDGLYQEPNLVHDSLYQEPDSLA